MTRIKDYPKDFVERTIILLNKLEPKAKELDLEVTFLLNCLLGMVVTVLENLNKLDKTEYNKSLFSIKLNNEKIKDKIPDKIKAIRGNEIINSYKEQFNAIGFLKNEGETEIEIGKSIVKFMTASEIRNQDFKWLLNKIRNGIAHQNIMPTSESENWNGIRIWNYNSNGLKDFAIQFDVDELKDFSLEVANRYLESLETKTPVEKD